MNCHRRRRFCIFFALLWTAAWASAAPPQRADVSAALSYTALQPGQQAVAAIVLDVHDGFHAQSHTPSNPNFIAMVVTLDENPALTALPPVYPAGKNVTYPDLGKLNVYTGRVIVHIPLHVKADAPPGLLKIAGSVVFQLCDEHTCYPPPKPPAAFTIETSIVPAGAAVQTQNPELFTGFDPTVFSRAAPAAPPSVAAAVSAASAATLRLEFLAGEWGVPSGVWRGVCRGHPLQPDAVRAAGGAAESHRILRGLPAQPGQVLLPGLRLQPGAADQLRDSGAGGGRLPLAHLGPAVQQPVVRVEHRRDPHRDGIEHVRGVQRAAAFRRVSLHAAA